jgi:ABC-type Na+ efflux pump permease subunit
MAIVLGIATISTFVINYLNSIMRFEGFKEGQHEDAPDEKENEDGDADDKQAYQNLALNPSIIPNADNIKKQVGKIDKLEKAYDDYDSVIKNNDFKSIPTDTKEIVSKQKDMLKQLKDMTPMLDQAMSTIQNINTTGLHKMLEGVNEMADSFGKN